MTWIALKMLTGDKPKFLGIVLGLTFAALLITQQGSIFCGLMCRTAGQVYDITGADLWVMDPNVRYIEDVKPMIENNLYRVRGVEGVEWAVPLYKGMARAKLNSTGIDPETKKPKTFQVIEQVILLGLDDTSMIGAPPPERLVAGSLADLRQPEAVMVDFTRLRKLYPGEAWNEEPPLPGMLQGAKEAIGHLLFEAGLIGDDPARDRYRGSEKGPGRFLRPVPGPGHGDERPPRAHRRRVRGDPDVSVQRGGLHHLLASQVVRAGGTQAPLVCAGQG